MKDKKETIETVEQLIKDENKISKKDLISFLIYETVSIRNLKDLKRVYGLFETIIKGIKNE